MYSVYNHMVVCEAYSWLLCKPYNRPRFIFGLLALQVFDRVGLEAQTTEN